MVVARRRHGVRFGAGRREYGLIVFRQGVPVLLVHQHHRRRVAFPPPRRVVVLGHLVEAEFFIVVRTHPLGGVDGAFLERGIDVATGDLLRHDAQALQHRTGDAADAELQALQIRDRLDFLLEPAAHLRARVETGKGMTVEAFQVVVEQLAAAALIPPGVVLARVHAEGDDRAKRHRRVLADVVVHDGLAGFDGAVLHRVEHLKARDDLAGGEHLDLELVVGRLRHPLHDVFRGADQRIEALGIARGHAPFDVGLALCQRRRGARRENAGDAAVLDEVSSFHLMRLRVRFSSGMNRCKWNRVAVAGLCRHIKSATGF